MSDDTIRIPADPEVPETSIDVDAPGASQPDGASEEAPEAGTAGGGTTGSETATPATGQARRRRRGSRGGRNRRKKPGTAAANGSSTASDTAATGDESVPAIDDDEIIVDDHTAAIADRGLTTDDIADVAREEAGLPLASPRIGDRRPAPAVRPEVGDTRPAAAAPVGDDDAATAAAPKKRRRRRGGRGRGRAGNGAAIAPALALDDVVHADLGTDDVVVALALDDDVLERRRGRTRKGRPAGRYLMCVHMLEGGHTHLAVLEGRNLVEHSLATPTGNEP